MMSLKVKRILALCVCCVLLAAAIYQNIRQDDTDNDVNAGTGDVNQTEDVIFVQDYNSEQAGTTDGEGVPTGVECGDPIEYIAGLRIEREAERSAFTEECIAIIEDTSSSETDVLNAQDDIIAVNSVTESEDLLESALKSRGYEDVFVEYSDEGFIDIVLVAENVTESEIETISAVVYSEIEVSPEFLTVSSVY